MREASFLFPSSRPVERFSSNQFSPCLPLHSLHPYHSVFTSPIVHFRLHSLLPQLFASHSKLTIPSPSHSVFLFLISPFVHQILTHTACRENARSPPAISRSVSLSITHMQTDNPPVHPTCQRKSLSDSCQVCPEVTKKKQETDEERTFRE